MNQSSNQLRYPAYRGGFNNPQFNGFCNFGPQYQHPRNGPPQRFAGPKNRQGYFNHNNPQQYRNPVVSNLRCGPPPPSSSPQWNARPQQRRFCHYEDDKRRRTSIDITPSLAPTLALPLSTARPPPKGPRTPPYPPPASEESDTEINSPAFEPISPKKPCNAESNESRRRQKKELKKIQRRRNSSASRPKRRLSQNARKSQKAEEPSPLNTAVQAYLLQVLTSQPPPGVVPTELAQSANDAVPATYLSQTALLHPPPPLSPEPNPTPPPLPPTPEIPPPPPLPAQQSYVDDEPLCFTSTLQSSEKGEESTRNATPGMLAIDVLDNKNNYKGNIFV